jgi:hypothetical protein
MTRAVVVADGDIAQPYGSGLTCQTLSSRVQIFATFEFLVNFDYLFY